MAGKKAGRCGKLARPAHSILFCFRGCSNKRHARRSRIGPRDLQIRTNFPCVRHDEFAIANVSLFLLSFISDAGMIPDLRPRTAVDLCIEIETNQGEEHSHYINR